MKLDIRHTVGDLPEGIPHTSTVAIDTEAMGLGIGRDRLCLVQLCFEPRGTCYLVQIQPGQTRAPRLQALLADSSILKLFHFGRFDISLMHQTFGTLASSVACTKIASRLARTYSHYHGLGALCKELLGIDLSKGDRIADWGAPGLTDKQKVYAARDVLYLHELYGILKDMLQRENRWDLAQHCFSFLPYRAALDVRGFTEDIFLHA